MKGTFKSIDPAVFWGSAFVIAAFVVWGLVAPENLGAVMSAALVVGHRRTSAGRSC